ncbi:MAG: tRNA pseudouridine(55) synthase TruB [Bacteroidetes bacterium]|jgi:tRNA pseudouridine55 synthase|nr:tRNA pseudouridine(55) synthase TruB [Bacteroidota bacterium]
MNFAHGYDDQEGELLLIDKPLHWTSFDVVKKVRYKLQHKLKIKKIKVGHAGTLDPLATGLVIISVGKYTKLINTYQDMVKEYRAIIKFGATTPSYDLETDIDRTFPVEHITLEKLKETAIQFLGEQDQMPPVYSAKKYNGSRAYEFARKGTAIALKSSKITIDQFHVLAYENQEAIVDVRCSKGTYIRSLAHDVGQVLNSGAYLKSLRRTAIGDYQVENALNIEEIEKKIENL